MKVLLLIAVLAVAGWFVWTKTQGAPPAPTAAPEAVAPQGAAPEAAAPPPPASEPNAAVRYTTGLQDDLTKAKAAAGKANAAVGEGQESRRDLQEAESR